MNSVIYRGRRKVCNSGGGGGNVRVGVNRPSEAQNAASRVGGTLALQIAFYLLLEPPFFLHFCALIKKKKKKKKKKKNNNDKLKKKKKKKKKKIHTQCINGGHGICLPTSKLFKGASPHTPPPPPPPKCSYAYVYFLGLSGILG